MPNVYETDAYRRRAVAELSSEERQAIRLLVMTKAWAGKPSGVDPSLFRMPWREYEIWYSFFETTGQEDGRKITLVALLPSGVALGETAEERSLIQSLMAKLRRAGLAMGLKEMAEWLWEILSNSL